jgi:hypothetical protein
MHLVDRRLTWSPLNRPPEILNAREGRLQWNGARKVVIYGAGLGRSEAPLDDPSWIVWALNVIPPLDRLGRVRSDCWWDIHQRRAQSADDLRWIASCPVPILVPDDLLDASPNAVRYPIERVKRDVADGPFACTFAYQIAYALLEGFTDIGLYGVELAYGTMRERTVEYASVSWWMGYAEAKGVTFHLPARSRLGTHRFLYGLEYDDEISDVKAYERMLADGDAHEARLKVQRASVGG